MFGLVPFATRNELTREGSLFDRLLDVFDEPFTSVSTPGFKVDVKDNGSAYELTAELPGLKKENISLSYEDNYLTIATRQEEAKDEKDDKGNYIRRERSYGQMSRSFYISGIDEGKATAEFTDGILKVQLPKAQEQSEKAHQIEISSSAA